MENDSGTIDSAYVISNRDGPENVVLEDVDCALGCPRKDQWILKGADRLHSLPGEYNVVKCCTCGLLRTNPRPTAGCMDFYYPDNYGPYLSTQVQPKNSGVASYFKRLLAPIVRKVLDTKSQALPHLVPGRMLEIGCASGAFLHSMAEHGWYVEGIELSPGAADEARKLGHAIHTGALENAIFSGDKFDLVVAWMVLEHLHDPVQGLKILADHSAPEAWLALSVPNAAASEFNAFGNRWYDLHLPNHLYHFTPKTLSAVLNAGGWTIESVHHQLTMGNFLNSCAYYFEDKTYPRIARAFRQAAQAGPFWRIFLYPIAFLCSLFGQTGRMTVWARKQA